MADWGKITSRGNVEDRRGSPIGIGGFGGGFGAVGLIVFLLLNFAGGKSPTIDSVLNELQNVQASQQPADSGEFAGTDKYETFSATVLGSNNDTWTDIFKQSGKTYTPPKLILFRSATQSGCGIAQSQVGPFYCPADKNIYLDETFFEELQSRFKAQGGDVAEAYVIAHEAGHHVQNELGIMDKVKGGEGDGSDSVKLELQADCFAGIWAHAVSAQGVFMPGEINEALDAAAAVGDDRVQQTTQGSVDQETWTHGSSAERVDWFNRGFHSGRPADCDTFHSNR